MSREPVKQSAYSDYLYQKIDQWFQQGRAGFTLVAMSKFTGLKITGNFRRRINHCVAIGKLEVRMGHQTSRPNILVFFRPDEAPVEDFPF